MNKQSENLSLMIKEVDTCNNYFDNHVSVHDNDYIRKVFIILVVIISMGILLI